MLARSTFCLFVLLLACINAQICTPTSVNTNLSVHLRTKNSQSVVQLGCANRKDLIECRFYTPYRTFVCNAYEGGCESPRYALIDGECCDIGSGCPKPTEKPVEPPSDTPVEPPSETPVDPPAEKPNPPAKQSVCTTTPVNSNVSVHVRTASSSSQVVLVCPNREKIQCRYYAPYRTFTCTAYDQPCGDSRYITVDGVCCDIGFGCPKPHDPYGPLESRVTILEGFMNSQKPIRSELANLTAEFLKFSSAQTQLQQLLNTVDSRDSASTKDQTAKLQEFQQQQLQLQQQQHQLLETQVKNEETTKSLQQQLQQLQQQLPQQIQLEFQRKFQQPSEQQQLLQQVQKQVELQQQQLQKQQQQLLTLEEQNVLLKKALEIHLKKQRVPQDQQQQQQKYPKDDYSNIQGSGYSPARSEENQASMTFLLIVIVMGVLGAISILVAVIIHKKKQARLTFRE